MNSIGVIIMTLKEAYEDYVFWHKSRGHRPNTINTYNWSVLNKFIPYFENMDIDLLTIEKIQKFVIDLMEEPVAQNTKAKHMRHIRGFLNFLYQNEYIDIDVCRKIPALRVEKKIKHIYTDDEIITMFAMVKNKSERSMRKRALLAVLINTGIRISDASRIKLEDINFEERYMIVHADKTYNERMVKLSLATIRMIQDYLRKKTYKSDYLFSQSISSKACEVRGLQDIIMNHVKIKCCIVRGNCHMFRHNFATRMYIETGHDSERTKILCGHRSYSTTRNYIHYATQYEMMNVSFEKIDILLAKGMKL